ncbi:hypothetical protein M3223_02575 [Paenibacillus pasadenensis]|uniref:hypothetical protein n=1 Tax=Paenibacillus pasadenensis TaxID=217090 RepID=UPI00203EBF31|nr:hypothetical protein [Paenibacillus pasadenensis]MCM3746234.1 hypothetical protein [Paenibacillus pasadenensis]
MNTESSVISKRKSVGIILVLFILLVIVTRVFYTPLLKSPLSGQPDDGSLSITASQMFLLNNQTSNYWLKPISFTGDGFENGVPVMTTIPPEDRYRFEILVSARRAYYAYVNYEIIDRSGSNAGSLQATMYTNGPFNVKFQDVTITGPFTQNSSYTTLNVRPA